LTLFVFINADGSTSTGGSAAATAIDNRLASDPTAGGYDCVVVVPADAEETPVVYAWTAGPADFVAVTPTPTPEPETTVGTDYDSVRQGGVERGYVELRVPLDAVNLTPACEGQIFIRSTSDEADVEPGDLSLGEAAADCRPADTDTDTIPDVAMPTGCTSDAQCPGTLICVDGECIFPPSEDTGPRGCTSDDQCPNDLVCVDGQCVFPGEDPPSETEGCTNDRQCPGNTICVDGECVFPEGVSTGPEGCTNDDQCPGDLVCVDGECVFTGASDSDTAQGCTSNSQCPGDLVCVDGQCVFPGSATGCTNDDQCPGDLVCEEGQCVYPPGSSGDSEGVQGCTSNSQCPNGLVCIDGECVFPDRCTSHSDCEPNEQCIDGACIPILQEGEEVRGGACTCGVPGQRKSSAPLALLALGALLWRWRRRRRRSRRAPAP
jgi:hypothetical protein